VRKLNATHSVVELANRHHGPIREGDKFQIAMRGSARP
jgi:hypothetical protein